MSGGSEIGISSSPIYRAVGIGLAVLSGVLIGISFILKKKGLISSRTEDGRGKQVFMRFTYYFGLDDNHAYLKSTMWWLGMLLMAVGEITNFVAYALAPAVLVTPLGALSVVVSAVLSSIFLKEILNFHGKLGCFISLLGAVIVVMHSPEQNVPDEIDKFMSLALAPVYTILIILGSVLLVWKVAPKYGKRHPIIYISICSFTGSLSVCTLQALGGAIIRTFYGDNQFSHWFIYILIVFVVLTIITQINYLNKALNEFVTAEVTPVYYVVFTTATIVSSAILYQGFMATAVSIVTLVFAFFIICSGVVILQTSRMYEALKSAEETMDTPREKPSNPEVQESEIPPEATVLEMSTSNVSLNPSVISNAIKPEGDLIGGNRITLTSPNSSTNCSKPLSHHSSFSKPLAIPHYLSSNFRKNSYQSSVQSSSGSIVSVIQRIGVAMNPEARDHLKCRTVFTDNQLEETCSHPLPTSIRSLSLTPSYNEQERRNSSGHTLKDTSRNNVVVSNCDLAPSRPIFRTTSSPLISNSKLKPGQIGQTLARGANFNDSSCLQTFDISAISEESDSSPHIIPKP